LVLTQEPKAGTEVEPGTAVSLVIGVAEQVTVPEIVGLTLDEAGRKLQDSGLAVGEVSQRPDEQVGIVLAQDPTDGEQVVRDTAVNLVVGHRRPDPGETVMGRIEGHQRFAQLGVSARQLTEHFGRLGIGSVEQAAELLTHPNPELRDSLGLSSLRQVQIFKRLLREIIETPN
jgi:hypothetical protein